MGGQGGNRANRATDLILVSMPKDLGMGNRLRPFPDTPDWPEWPKRPFWAILARSKLAKIITWVQSMLQIWFSCLSLGFWAWKIDWDHFQTPQINLSGQNGHFGNFGQVWIGQNCNLGSEHATDLILVSIPRFLGMGNRLRPFLDTPDWPEWPKWPHFGPWKWD